MTISESNAPPHARSGCSVLGKVSLALGNLGAVATIVTACSAASPSTNDPTRTGSLSATATPIEEPSLATAPSSAVIDTGTAVVSRLSDEISLRGIARASRIVTVRAMTTGTASLSATLLGRRVAGGEVLARLENPLLLASVAEARNALDEATIRLREQLVPDSLVSGVGPSAERRTYAEVTSGFRAAATRLARVQAELALATIRAPFGGTVEHLAVQDGEYISSGHPIAVVASTGDMTIEAIVLTIDALRIPPGSPATIVPLQGGSSPIPGRVIHVSAVVDSVRHSVMATIKPLTPLMLPSGAQIEVRVRLSQRRPHLVVPASAIVERGGRQLVFRIVNGQAEWVYITPGFSDGTLTEVDSEGAGSPSALKPGDTVATQGHLSLSHQAKVTIRPIARGAPSPVSP